METLLLVLLVHVERNEQTCCSFVCVGFLGGGIHEFVIMCFIAHHSQGDNLSVPEQVSSGCYLSQADPASTTHWSYGCPRRMPTKEKMASKAHGAKVWVFTWKDGEQNFSPCFDLAGIRCLKGSFLILVADTSLFLGLYVLSKDFCIYEESKGVNLYLNPEFLFPACHVEKCVQALLASSQNVSIEQAIFLSELLFLWLASALLAQLFSCSLGAMCS